MSRQEVIRFIERASKDESFKSSFKDLDDYETIAKMAKEYGYDFSASELEGVFFQLAVSEHNEKVKANELKLIQIVRLLSIFCLAVALSTGNLYMTVLFGIMILITVYESDN